MFKIDLNVVKLFRSEGCGLNDDDLCGINDPQGALLSVEMLAWGVA